MGHKPPVWKGSKQLTQAPDSPEYSETANGEVYIYNYAGPFAVVISSKPRRLSTFKGLPTGFAIDSVSVKKAPGGVGKLSFTAAAVAASGFTSEGAEDPEYEVEWTEVSKRIESHPRYATGGACPMTDEDFAQVEKWRDEPNPQFKKDFKVSRTDGTYDYLSDNAKDLAKKILRGTDSYSFYIPICRVTTKHAKKPATGKCGSRSRPPLEVMVAGYEYLKSADRANRHSRFWTRVQEWTGAESVDHNLYPGA